MSDTITHEMICTHLEPAGCGTQFLCVRRVPRWYVAQDYLSDEEFLSAMGMARAQFAECKKWKQTSMKKKVGIY